MPGTSYRGALFHSGEAPSLIFSLIMMCWHNLIITEHAVRCLHVILLVEETISRKTTTCYMQTWKSLYRLQGGLNFNYRLTEAGRGLFGHIVNRIFPNFLECINLIWRKYSGGLAQSRIISPGRVDVILKCIELLLSGRFSGRDLGGPYSQDKWWRQRHTNRQNSAGDWIVSRIHGGCWLFLLRVGAGIRQLLVTKRNKNEVPHNFIAHLPDIIIF